MRLLLFSRAADLATIALVIALKPGAFAAERNPLMVTAFHLGGLAGIALVELAATGALAALLRRTRRWERTAWPLYAILAASLVGPLSNLHGLLFY